MKTVLTKKVTCIEKYNDRGKIVYRERINLLDDDNDITTWEYDDKGRLLSRKNNMNTWLNKECRYDEKGNEIYLKHYDFESDIENTYDNKGRLILSKFIAYNYALEYKYDESSTSEYIINYNNDGSVKERNLSYIQKYDKNGNKIYYKSYAFNNYDEDYEEFNIYTKDGKLKATKNTKYKQWNYYNDNGLLSRTKRRYKDGYVLETYFTYNDNGKCVHVKMSDGSEKWYDDNEFLVKYKDPNGEIEYYEVEED